MAKKNESDSFPRIVTSAKIKSYTKDNEGITVKFKGLAFTTSQQEILDDMLVNEEDLVITLASQQGRLT